MKPDPQTQKHVSNLMVNAEWQLSNVLQTLRGAKMHDHGIEVDDVKCCIKSAMEE